MGRAEPDIRVAIDFGTTSTGVAWNTPKDPNPIIFTNWPGNGPQQNEEKVPTVLAKLPDATTGAGVRWGFLCSDLDELVKWRYLKVFLDPAVREEYMSPGVPETYEQVVKLITIYLREVYVCIATHIPDQVRQNKASRLSTLHSKKWDDWKVEFRFSIPATWTPEITKVFRSIIRDAGFDKSPCHTIRVDLTEAEAATAYTIEELDPRIDFLAGDSILSIDAGGGTTDIAFVEASAGGLTVRSATAVEAGSAMIDRAFEASIEKRLGSHAESSCGIAREIAQDEPFQSRKCNFEDIGMDVDFRINLPLGYSTHNPDIGVIDGVMALSSIELKAYFDDQLSLIKGMIKRALSQVNLEKDHLKYVALTGGLGASPYVYVQLSDLFRDLRSRDEIKCVKKTQSLQPCKKPRLAVVKGLLIDNIKSLRARYSYGVVVQQEYSPEIHFRQPCYRNPVDGKKYVNGQIQWLVKMGQDISRDSRFTCTMTKTLLSGEQREWSERIICCGTDLEFLPENISNCHAAIERSFDVSLHDDAKPMKQPRRFWKSSSKGAMYEWDFTLALGTGEQFEVIPGKNVKDLEGERKETDS